MVNKMNVVSQEWLDQLTSEFNVAQLKAHIMINRELFSFFVDLGREIKDKTKGELDDAFVNALSKELIKGTSKQFLFSPKNISYILKFYEVYGGETSSSPDLLDRLAFRPWGHHRAILDKCQSFEEAFSVVEKTIAGNWSEKRVRDYLES